MRKGIVMKKRFNLLVIGLSILLLATGCQKKGNSELGYDLDDHLKLGKYKGVEVAVGELEVTDDDVEDAINYYMSLNAEEVEVKDRAVKDGDIVNIDFEGFRDGVAFEGGAGTDFNLTIGSNQFIEGFEEKLIGTKTGDKVELNLTFPETYHAEEMRGKEVVFKVTVNAIKEINLPVLTDEYVIENTDYDTVDAYKQSIREELETQYKEDINSTKMNDVYTAILEDSEIKSYPDVLIDEYKASLKEEFNYYASISGIELEAFLNQYYQMTLEQFEVEAQTYAENRASLEMILQAIIDKENIKLSNDEYQEGIEKYFTELGITTEEQLFEYVTEDEIRKNLLLEKAFEFISDSAIEL